MPGVSGMEGYEILQQMDFGKNEPGFEGLVLRA